MTIYQFGSTPRIRAVAIQRTRDNSLVTSLGPGESIAYMVTDASGTQLLSGSTTTAEVTHAGGGTWEATLTGLPLGPAHIRWVAIVDDGETVWDDALHVSE